MTSTAFAPHTPDKPARPDNDVYAAAAPTTFLSVAHRLAMAREDLHHAIAADDHQRALQYALSTRENAGAALTHPGALATELHDAGHYFAHAEAIIAEHGGDPDTA